MATFAVINNETVENIIVCENVALAEQVTEKTCVELEYNSPVSIGWTYKNNSFIKPEL